MSKTTTDHNEIRRWVTEPGGYPARVKGTDASGSSGVLRIDYPGFRGEESLEAISWTEFFNGFEKNKLEFLYEDEPENRFSKLIDRTGKGH